MMGRADPISLETRSAAIKLAASEKPVRIAMRGNSMLPDLREGMVLEIRSGRPARLGDIVVFRSDRRLVAHRAVAVRTDTIVCAGDAQPDSLEYVATRDAVGVVERVYDAQGRQVATPAWRLRGFLRARFRPARAVLFHALPHLRGRAYASLFNVMSAAVRGDARALADAIRQDAPWRLPAMARRHRCAAALCAALEPLADDEVASALRAALRKDRWSVRVRQARFAAQLERVVQTLQAAGLEPLLLKGAQRVACATPESALFDSHDIDVLVAPDCVERACEALRAAGYRQDPHPALDYDRHHHAAPLFMQGAIPVEVHRALSLHTLKVPIAWADLKLRARVESSPFGPVTILDPAATAMHLAVHCLQRPALRELVLLARQLQRLDEYETACVRGMLSREQQYAVPLNAAMLLASRLAGTKWACDARAERFAEWMLVREDLPRPLRARVECADAWLAGVALVPSAGKLRAAQRVCTAIAIALYVPFMRR